MPRGHPINPQTFWTQPRMDMLKRNWLKYSAWELAKLIGSGCTKNMIIGKARRMDLPPKQEAALDAWCQRRNLPRVRAA